MSNPFLDLIPRSTGTTPQQPERAIVPAVPGTIPGLEDHPDAFSAMSGTIVHGAFETPKPEPPGQPDKQPTVFGRLGIPQVGANLGSTIQVMGKGLEQYAEGPTVAAPPVYESELFEDSPSRLGRRHMPSSGVRDTGRAMSGFGQRMREAEPALQITDYSKIRNAADLGTYIWESAQQAVGSSLPIIAGGVVTGPFALLGMGSVGYTMGVGTVRHALEQERSKITDQAQRAEALGDTADAARMRATAESLDPKNHGQLIYSAGAVIGMLDTIVPASLFARPAQGQVVKQLTADYAAKVMAAYAARGLPREGITEALQQATQVAAVAKASGADSALAYAQALSNNATEIIDSGLRGAIGGATLSGAHGARHAYQTTRVPERPPGATAEPPAAVVPVEAPPPQPTQPPVSGTPAAISEAVSLNPESINPDGSVTLYRGEAEGAKRGKGRQVWTADARYAEQSAGPGGKVYEVQVPADRVGEITNATDQAGMHLPSGLGLRARSRQLANNLAKSEAQQPNPNVPINPNAPFVDLITDALQQARAQQQPARGGWALGRPMEVVTPDSTLRIPAVPTLVELDDLIAATGDVQPRDRSRQEYLGEAALRANQLDPERLMPNRVADSGAPIVAPDGQILSGNGRVESLKQVYRTRRLGMQADRYRSALPPEAQGMREPVLVMLAPDMAPAERARFADLANRPAIAQMSAPERAVRDAKAMGPDLMGLYQGGEFTSPENASFVRSFVMRVVTPQERNAIIRNNELTQEGVARMRAAVLGAAYGDDPALSRMLESTDDNIRSLAAGLRDAAPRMMQLKASIAAGETAPEMDPTPTLLTAVRTIGGLRANKVPIQTWLAQTDAFGRDPEVEAWVKGFYYDQSNRALGAQKVAAILNSYVDEAIQHKPAESALFADETTRSDVMRVARGKIDADRQGQGLFGTDENLGAGVPQGRDAGAGRALGASGQRSAQETGGSRPDATVAGRDDQISEALAALYSSPDALARDAKALVRRVADTADRMAKAGASPAEIAAAVNKVAGTTHVTAQDVASGNVWWDTAPSYKAFNDTPIDVELMNKFDTANPDMIVAPMDVDARPASPPQLRGIEGGSSRGPVLSAAMRAAAIDAAKRGLSATQIAAKLDAETGQFVPVSLIEQVLDQAGLGWTPQPQSRGPDISVWFPQVERRLRELRSAGATDASIAETLSRELRTDITAKAVRRQRQKLEDERGAPFATEVTSTYWDDPVVRAIYAERMRQTNAEHGLTTANPEHAKKVIEARGGTVWTSAMVEALGTPDMRKRTAKAAADALNEQFGVALTEVAVAHKRSDLGYRVERVRPVETPMAERRPLGRPHMPPKAEAPKKVGAPSLWTDEMDFALKRMDTLSWADAADRINSRFGTSFGASSIKSRRAKIGTTRARGQATTTPTSAWTPEIEQRLSVLMPQHRQARGAQGTSAPRVVAKLLNDEFGTSFSAAAVDKRWRKVRDAALRQAGDEPMFAIGGFAIGGWNPKDWLDWIKGTEHGSDRQPGPAAQDSGTTPAESGVIPGQQSRADAVRETGDDRADTSGRRGWHYPFPVGADFMARLIEGPATVQGLRQADLVVRNKASWYRNDPSTWIAKGRIKEVAPDTWTIEQLQVRRNKQRQGIGNQVLDAVEQQLGDGTLVAPSVMTPQMYGFWRKREMEGSRFRITSVDDYVRYGNQYYKPERLRDLYAYTQAVAETAAKGSLEANLARKELAQLEDVVERLPPDDEIMAAVGSEPLDMSPEARKARAEQMGFDTSRVLYHGSSNNFEQFRPSRSGIVYLTDRPDIAEIYANVRSGEGGAKWAAATGRTVNAEPNIIPVYIRNQNPLIVSDKGPDGSHGWVHDNLQDALGLTGKWRYPDLFTEARNRGHDVVEVRDMTDLGGDQTQYMVLDPRNIRSVNAAFDPRESDSADLMAAAGRDADLKAAVERRLERGQVVRVDDGVVSRITSLINRNVSMLPSANDAGVVVGIKPNADFKSSGVVQLAIRMPTGEKVNAFLPWGDVVDLRAATLDVIGRDGRRRPAVAIFRLDVTGYTDQGFRGELAHEVVHLLRRLGVLDKVGLDRLAAHSNDLRVLDMPLRDYLSTIGYPGAESQSNIPLRRIYDRRYAGRADRTDVMKQEAAAHLLEGYANGAIDVPADIAPILDSILDGSIWRERQEETQGELRMGEPVAAASTKGEPLAAASRSRLPETDTLGYYSKALEAAKDLKQSKGTPEQMLAQLKSAGVKDAEIEATGLRSILDGKPTITRDEIVSYLTEHRVGLREVRYAGDGAENRLELYGMRPELIEDDDGNVILRREGTINGREYTAYLDEDAGNAWVEGPNGEQIAATGRMNRQTWDNAYEAIERHASKAGVPEGVAGPAKWSNYSLDPSNPSYRETVIHLPPSFGEWQVEHRPQLNEYVLRSAATDELMTRPGGSTAIFKSADEAEAAASRGGFEKSFQSGHFPEPNIVGHMMTSMVKHEGKPTYLIDQIQSDWGQKLRDGGVRDEAKIAQLKQFIADDEARLKQLIDERNRFVDEHADDRTTVIKEGVEPGDGGKPLTQRKVFSQQYVLELMSTMAPTPEVRAQAGLLQEQLARHGDSIRLRKAELRTAEASPPGHPLVNTTDQWVNTTLRRAIRQAAEADADYIAIPHGDTVLSYNPGDEAGMRGFYGSRDSEGIVPKNLRKLLEKIDKAAAKPIKVEQLETTRGLEGYQHADTRRDNSFDFDQTGFTLFPITDTVKRTVLDDGQPLFALGGITTPGANMDSYAEAVILSKRGESPDTIWDKTGWYKDNKGKWKFEGKTGDRPTVAEARMIAKRDSLTPEERKARPPYRDYEEPKKRASGGRVTVPSHDSSIWSNAMRIIRQSRT